MENLIRFLLDTSMEIIHKLVSWSWSVASLTTTWSTVAMLKVLMGVLNTCNVHHEERLYDAVVNRSRDQPLITIMNHCSFLDGFVIGHMLRWSYITSGTRFVPWSPAAKEIGFRNTISANYFSLIKNVPISRGEGIYQPSMTYIVNRLNCGEWTNIFPEGKISRNNETLEYKLGVVRLIVEPKVRPIILPIYHLGTADIIPNRKPIYPRVGKTMTVLVGKPIHFCDELEDSIKCKDNREEVWTSIASALREEMIKLRVEATKLH